MERELWTALYRFTVTFDKPWGRWRYSDGDIVGVYLWAVIHDRPTRWATDPRAWPDDLRPTWLPTQSTLSRRLRRSETVELMTRVEQHLVELVCVGQFLVQRIDGKALAVSPVSKDPDAGYGRGAGASQKGYKFHAVWAEGPMPRAWALTAMNASEKTLARSLIAGLPGGGYLLGDVQYDVGYLFDLAAAEGFQLVTQKTAGRSRNGLGHRRQSPARLRSIELLKTAFGRELYKQRRAIESRFGTLTCVGGGLAPLPAWVRRFHRVRNWVQAKLILAGVRWLLRNDPQKLALA